MRLSENWTYHRQLQGNPTGIDSISNHIPTYNQKFQSELKAGQRGISRYAHILGNPTTRMQGVCRFVKQNPYHDGHTITKAYLKLLDHVQNYLVITDPVKSDTFTTQADKSLTEKLDPFDYFNLLHQKVQSYMKTGKRLDYITTNINMTGNENVAIMNEKISEDLANGNLMAANKHLGMLMLSNKFYGDPHYKNLLKDYVPFKNTHVWTHMSFMHSKVFYFDRIVASVGSLNFQHNATDQAYESTAICMDENLNRELDRVLVQDMANSIPLIFAK